LTSSSESDLVRHRLDFADAYLAASAERTGIGVIASFDRTIDHVTTARREEPS
jgi:predicted nucleic acid-binding protein